MKTIAQLLPVIAARDLGLHEIPLGSNSGPMIQKFFDADFLDPNGARPGDTGYAWCAAAVCFWVMIAIAEWEAAHGRKVTFKRPGTAAAFGFENWSLAQDGSTQTKTGRAARNDIRKGDIVIFSFSHICIATTDRDHLGFFETIEGNTNKEGSREGTHVMEKTRNVSSVRSRIRFTV